IHVVLDITISEAIQCFGGIAEQQIDRTPSPQSSGRDRDWEESREADAKRQVSVDPCIRISDGLKVLDEVGLGYLRLGQPLNTLSGGESQRLKLVGHLREAENVQRSVSNAKHSTGEAIGNLYRFVQQTTGRHADHGAMHPE